MWDNTDPEHTRIPTPEPREPLTTIDRLIIAAGAAGLVAFWINIWRGWPA